MEHDYFLEDELNEECGVFGVFNVDNAQEITYYGLHSLQHRGQEGCGIVSVNDKQLSRIKGEGLVTEVFNNNNLTTINGNMAIGHVRYSTAGGGGIENVQPFLFRHHTGDFGLCHNGNIVNSDKIKHYLEKEGSIFQSTSDSEILAHLIKRDKQKNRLEAIKDSLRLLEGAFAFLMLTGNKLYAMRDKYGLRPLSLGKLDNGYVISSETCALEIVGAKFIRDVEPGEIITITSEGIKSCFYAEGTNNKMCAMEYIYFSRPDSDIEGKNVHATRKECGKMLAKNETYEADLVIGVPDSSLSAASGFAEALGIPFEMGLIKNKYVGRTFISPSQEMREKGVKMKLSPVRSIVKDKRVILVDDSIVRGTTSKRIVTMLKESGAKEIHIRIASPAITHPCFYGVDTSTYQELISSRLNADELCAEIKADSLRFLTVDELMTAVGRKEMCVACFNGKYPTHIYGALENANKDGKF